MYKTKSAYSQTPYGQMRDRLKKAETKKQEAAKCYNQNPTKLWL